MNTNFYIGNIANFALGEKIDSICAEQCIAFDMIHTGIKALFLPDDIGVYIFNANCIILCDTALPHNDSENFSNKCFLTLVVQSNHWIGCESYIDNSQFEIGVELKSRIAVRGDIFLIDADETHWAIPKDYGEKSIFCGLQWDFDKSDPMLQEKIDAILAKLRA